MIRKISKICIPILITVLLVFCAWYFDLKSLLNVESFRAFESSHGFWSVIVFILIYVISIILFFPASILSILAGVFFGSLLGFVYSMIGIMLGAIIAFYIARHYGRGFVEKITHKRFDKINEYNKKVSENGFITVLFCRLTPLIPFKVPNYILGLTKIRFRDYFTGTFLGMIPETFILVYFGDSLSTLSIWKIALAISLITIFFIFGFYYKDSLFKF